MDRDERQQLRALIDEVAGWARQAHSVLSHRAEIDKAGQDAMQQLRRAVVAVQSPDQDGWRVMLLRSADSRNLGAVAKLNLLPAMSAGEYKALDVLTTQAAEAVRDAKSLVGTRRFFSGSRKREAGTTAADFLRAYRETGQATGLPDLLHRLGENDNGATSEVPLTDALADWVGLRPRISDIGPAHGLLAAAVLQDLPNAIATIDRAIADEARFRAVAVTAGETVRRGDVYRLLAEMPVERLKEATRDRLRVGPLTDAGITTVQSVLDNGAALEYLPGIGATTATRMRGAAHALWQTTYDEMPVRIDIRNRTSEATTLLRALGEWDSMRRTRGASADIARAQALTPLVQAMDRHVSHLVILSNHHSPEEFLAAIDAVKERARKIVSTTVTSQTADPWDDFLRRPADYFAMLAELGFITEDEEKAHGDLPEDIVDAIRRLELDTEHLTASLRGYQSFGARFALVQRKVIIGDEMGLGKTVEALAVLAHLRARGSHHSMVICPAAVVTNWIREIQSKSALMPHRIHGPGREAAARMWLRNGGVGVTTFETLGWLERQVHIPQDLGCVVVDEAHYIKNPAARRTQRTTRLLAASDRAILLTGTPLENRLDEFRNLVGYLRPDLVVDVDEFAPRRFRRQVAPAYLRRNQEDVLTELPELVEVDEWLPMSGEDSDAYREAVATGNFMAMRQAALSHNKAEKMQRLLEIVEEARDNGRRLIVFSHFRNVLDLIAQTLPGPVFGPLTGSVAAAARQTMVDQFSAAEHGAVLVAQIVAGGVGLNIQAASVVVICEPQLKPTTEWQAIARAHRMGQLETVQVHRLLSEEGVDWRITEILAKKRDLFDEFARISETAGSAPEAYDLSEAALAREVVAAERERLFSKVNENSEPAQGEAAI